MKWIPFLAIAGGVAFAAGAADAPRVAADTPTAETPTAAQLADLTASEVALLESDTAIDVVMDPATGDIISVVAATGGSAISQISNRSPCESGDGCYLTNKTPYSSQGFYGSAGTYDGSWPYRSGYSAGNYSVSACWGSGCGPEVAAGSKVTFTTDVTGTSFTIY